MGERHPMRDAGSDDVREEERDNHLKKGNLEFGFGVEMEDEVIKVETRWVT